MLCCKDCKIQDRKAHEKSEAYALLYMKIEMGAKGVLKHWLGAAGFIIKIKYNIIFIN